MLRYFILYAMSSCGYRPKYLIKGKNYNHVADRIEHYAEGYLVTDKFLVATQNLDKGFLLEIDLNYYPEYDKREFGIINENKSRHPDDYIIYD